MDSMKRVFVRIKNEIQNMLLAIFALSSILILALFIIKPSVNILAYENSFEFYNSNVNRLYIKISGRMKILENNVEKTFILLENHPRENTFDNNVQPYSDMIKSSDGASFISFIMGNDGSSVIERRYQSKQSEDIQHQCIPNPFGSHSKFDHPEKMSFLLREVTSYDELLWFSARGFKLYGTVAYKSGKAEVSLDFPVTVLNMNPLTGGTKLADDELWQAVSARTPVYVEGQSLCESIRAGYVALRRFDGPFEIVYLCRNSQGINDFSCVSSQRGRARIFVSYI